MDIERIKELYTYDKETGEFTKLSNGSKSLGKTGLRIDGKKVSKSKLAWALSYGEAPKHMIKFIDGDSCNFKLDNLGLHNTYKGDTRTQAEKDEVKRLVDEMSEVIAGGYDDKVYSVAVIGTSNAGKLRELGYDIPKYRQGFEWLIKTTDLAAIGSGTLVQAACSECGTWRAVQANRITSRCIKCGLKGIPKTREHRLAVSRAKMDTTLTDEDRVSRRRMPLQTSWAREVKEEASFTCEACGQIGGELHSHHKDSYRSNPMRRLDTTNGSCLCTNCHKDFHKQYGLGNNTVDQYETWILDKLDEREGQ